MAEFKEIDYGVGDKITPVIEFPVCPDIDAQMPKMGKVYTCDGLKYVTSSVNGVTYLTTYLKEYTQLHENNNKRIGFGAFKFKKVDPLYNTNAISEILEKFKPYEGKEVDVKPVKKEVPA